MLFISMMKFAKYISVAPLSTLIALLFYSRKPLPSETPVNGTGDKTLKLDVIYPYIKERNGPSAYEFSSANDAAMPWSMTEYLFDLVWESACSQNCSMFAFVSGQ